MSGIFMQELIHQNDKDCASNGKNQQIQNRRKNNKPALHGSLTFS
jgi:hypothetical protein